MPWVVTVKEEGMPLLLKSQTGLASALGCRVQNEVRSNVHLGVCSSDAGTLSVVVHHVSGAVTGHRRGHWLGLGGSFSRPRCAHKFEITQEGGFRVACQRVVSSNLESSCWAQACKHTHTHRHTHTQAPSRSLYLPLLVCSGQMALGSWVASFCTSVQLDPFFCGGWQAVG